MRIYREPSDYAVFLNLFKRYLSEEETIDSLGVPYPHLAGSIELLTYCLMTNHFHLLLYQIDEGAMARLMRGLMTSYSRYFNKKYHRSGALFESRYKASMITTDGYLQHISRYIHLNPKDWPAYKYSSLPFYLGAHKAGWIRPSRILELFASAEDYHEFVKDYEDNKKMLEEFKHELANDRTPYTN